MQQEQEQEAPHGGSNNNNNNSNHTRRMFPLSIEPSFDDDDDANGRPPAAAVSQAEVDADADANETALFQQPLETATTTTAATTDTSTTNNGRRQQLLRGWNHPPVAAVALPEERSAVDDGSTTIPTSSTATAATAAATTTSVTQQQQQQVPPSSPPQVEVVEALDALSASACSPYSPYPVATFVRDLVRTSISYVPPVATIASGSLAAAATATATTTTAATDHQHHHRPYMRQLSVRSDEADMQTMEQRHQAVDQHRQYPDTFSARTANELDLGGDFVLVDGEIIEIPPDPPQNKNNDDDEDGLSRRTLSFEEEEKKNNAAVCNVQPSRVRRGVRSRIHKFFRKRVTRARSDESAATTTTTPDGTTGIEAIRSSSVPIPKLIQDDPRRQQQHQQQHHHPPLEGGGRTDHHHVDGKQPALPLSELFRETQPSERRHSRAEQAGVPEVAAAAAAARKGAPNQQQKPKASSKKFLKKSPKPASVASMASSSSSLSSNISTSTGNQQKKSASPNHANNKRRNRLGMLKRGSWRKADSTRDVGLDNSNNSSNERQNTRESHLLGYPEEGVPPRINEAPDESLGQSTAQSVTASFMCTVDQLQEAGVVLPAAAAEAFVESYEDPLLKKDDDDGHILTSVLPPNASDYKVDKNDAPDVDDMLRRAHVETFTDLEVSGESIILPPPPRPGRAESAVLPGKSDGSSVPLSEVVARGYNHLNLKDEVVPVHNDILKVVMVGATGVDKVWVARAIRNSTQRPRRRTTLAVNVHTWVPGVPPTPSKQPSTSSANKSSLMPSSDPVKFQIWDIQGATARDAASANFGAHPSTHSLFFSSRSLYLLVWDLAGSNQQTYHRESRRDSEDFCRSSSSQDLLQDGFSDDDEDHNDFLREEHDRQADRVLHADIQKRVVSWVDCITHRGPQSAVLPVALIPKGMNEVEVQRRCDMMQNLLEKHVDRFIAGDKLAPKLLTGAENIISVQRATGEGIVQLQDTIQAIACDARVFDHVACGKALLPPESVQVLAVIRRLKQDHKLILLDHLLAELGPARSDLQRVVEALHFLSSTGEILYFGTANDEVLSRYIILSRKWLVSALSCILRNDLKRELTETRRFMNMQCIYSHHEYRENEVTAALVNGTDSTCPLLSDKDANMLWQSMSFMKEAADRNSDLAESSTTAPTMFYFLQRLLIHAGIFVPLGCSASTLDHSEVFFVPSLLAQAEPRDIWTYKSMESWRTTLCHSWLFRDGAPFDLMERISVRLLKDLYEFTISVGDAGKIGISPSSSQTEPFGTSSLHSFLRDHDNMQTMDSARVKIHQVMCWKTSMLVKIGTIFCDEENGERKESFVEIFVTVVDQSSRNCVSSDAMRAGMHRVVVSGKGQVGRLGRKLWQGGYRIALESVQATLKENAYTNVDNQVVCPECLAHTSPSSASTWSWDSVAAASESGSSVIRCMRGHRVDSNLICGSCIEQETGPTEELAAARPAKKISELLPSLVLVGLWDQQTKEIKNVGSGVIVCNKKGLIVTAGHILFNMEEGPQFGSPYFGLKSARVVVGVIPDEGHNAVFRYFAEIVTDDIHSVDACVLRIVSRMENDVDDEGAGCADQSENVLELKHIAKEELRALKVTTRFQLEESVRILGFNQGGEGVLKKGKHINRSADFAKGYVCKEFKAFMSDDSSHSSDSSSQGFAFSPREEIVIMCPTISGHSGGPCVNEEGRVIGILSRADPVDRQRCYLVPSSEIKNLIFKAKKQITRPATQVSKMAAL